MAVVEPIPGATKTAGKQRQEAMISQRRSLLAVACAACACLALLSVSARAFAAARPSSSTRGRIAVHAEEAPAPAPPPGSSVALVKVTEESKFTTASVLGGLAGLWFGGVWVGAGLFVASAWLTRNDKDSDVSKAISGVSGAGLEVVNFVANIEAKYEVTGKIGSAITDAIDTAKADPDKKVVAESASSILQGAQDAIKSVDEDVGIKDTLGSIASSASELGYTAIKTIGDLNDKYKVTDKIKDKLDEATKN